MPKNFFEKFICYLWIMVCTLPLFSKGLGAILLSLLIVSGEIPATKQQLLFLLGWY